MLGGCLLSWTQILSDSIIPLLSPPFTKSSPGSMGSSPRLFGRQRSVYQILGGGFISEVMLWRRRDVTIGILIGVLSVWVVFEVSGHTLLWLVSSVLLLLISILFVWAKAAAVINRPPPPIPRLHLSEEIIDEAVIFVHSHVNTLLSGFHDIALGKDSKLFYKVAACLWLLSIAGRRTDLLTFSCTSIVILLTVPVLYEKYEDIIDTYVTLAYMEMERVYAWGFSKVKLWNLEKEKKLS